MAGWQNWITYRSEKQRKEDRENYDRNMFPHGIRQKEKITDLLKQLVPEETRGMAMYNYLCVRQGMMNEDSRETLRKAIMNTSNKRHPEYLNRYMALVSYDLGINDELEYPDMARILLRAEEINK